MTTYTANTRRDALHTLGTSVPEGTRAADALALTGLAGWNVHKRPLETATLWTPEGGAPRIDQAVAVPNFYATVRDLPDGGHRALGVVGRVFHPVQNEDIVELLDAITDQGAGTLATGGAMRGDRDVFMSIKLPESMTVGGVDVVDKYIAVFNSHDGNSALRVAVTPLRVICSNMLHAVMRGAQHSMTIRHTRNAKQIMRQAAEVLQLAHKYDALLEAEAERMIQQTMTDAAFEELVRGIWAEPAAEASKATKTIDQRRMSDLQYLFHDAETQANIRGTAWAGYQSVVEYVDHVAGAVKGEHAQTVEEARALRSLMGDTARDTKSKAFRLTKEMVAA